ncbi:adenylate/guanylate cyclase domain-containing protein [Microvirga lenta]|uniref:adenylate/guanylate cyclase domain-containing protein n=1 Tax=Microvirga lenta TaxID=2881337 RepID=UPI001CFF6B95|nr:adenylate/guanylate cyclase domain-containing protein [Microvirga lenta]MCB5176848.1 tetratricopeptide repeat protein [Microvirga lenta]
MPGPSDQKSQRRLAAILAADVAGYSGLMSLDEEGTLLRLRHLRREVVVPTIQAHGGRLVKTTGDGFLIEFSSPVEAVRCAAEIQEALAAIAAEDPATTLWLRIGINLCDIIIDEDGDVYGDGVNVASRLEQIAVPGGICISGKVWEEVRGKVPYAFEDRGEQQVRNIARPIRIYCLNGAQGPPELAMDASPSLALPDRPSIAVLPFVNISGDPEQEHLADGIVEDITSALSRVRSFFVIARNSAFAYKGRAVNFQQISRELGVRYALEGSVRRAGNRVRISAQLIDATEGTHLWAEHYDGVVEDLFDFQDQITASVVGAIQPSIRAAEIERAKRKRPESLDAYDLVMRALPLVWALERESNLEATHLLEEALRLDPTYPLALSLLAWCRGQRVVYNWTERSEEERQEALRQAQAAVSLSSDDPFTLAVLGAALSITREFGSAAAVLARALALDPNSAWAWNRSGWLHDYRGDAETAISHFERALRLSPFDPMAFNCDMGIGAAHFIAGRYEESIAWQEKALMAHPNSAWIHRNLAPAYALAGQRGKAAESVRELLKAYPGMRISDVTSALAFTDEVLGRIAEGLRLAGLPE